MRYILVSALLLLAIGTLSAQKGTITGVITADEGGREQPMPFVNVVLKGTTTGATTDLDGRYSFQADAGLHTLLVSFVGYEPVERPVTVEAGRTVQMPVKLHTQAIEMKAVEVATVRRTGTESAVLMETRQSQQVVNGVGREQITKSQDRNAGEVVRRIPGVTLVGDRFVMIRGLADRYNTVMLNDVMAPSLEPDKRAFSFDLIPAGALDRVLIHKTGAAELPGEFAGGVIRLNTLSVPAENETRFTYSTSVREGTTFQPFQQDAGSGTDALGFDNGVRDRQGDLPANINKLPADRLTALGRDLPNNWQVNSTNAMPDQRFNLLLARRFGKGGGNTYGNITSIDYSNTRAAFTARNLNYNAFDPIAQRSDTIYDYRDQENIHAVRLGVLHNWTALLGTRTKIEFRNLLNQLGENRTTVRTGSNFEEGFDVRNYAFRYQQRTIYSGQLHGQHDVAGDRGKLSWTLGYGKAISKEPDFRRVRTVRDLEMADSDQPYRVIIPPGASTLDAGRFYSTLDETVMTGRVDHQHTIGPGSQRIVPKIMVGVFAERKDREFTARWMSFKQANLTTFDNTLLSLPLESIFAPENINNTTGFKLEEGTNPSDRYTAANTLVAGYLGTSIAIDRTFNLSVGLRAEYNRQELASRTYTNERILVDNPVLSLLPSLNSSYNLTERSLVRVAWSNTVNRPEFRELAPFSFYDFSFNNVLYGNERLRGATIMNLDARWELYPTAAEIVSVGAFYKRFTDPIEMFFVPGTGSGGTRNFTYGNAASATSVGVEVEVRHSLRWLSANPVWERWGTIMNGALIHSDVDLGAAAVGQSAQRPMMGQSPYVVNAGIFYQQPEKRFQANLLYNVFGRRLFAVGTFGTPDIYEMPRHSLDLALTKGLGKRFEIRAAVQDILNQTYLFQQDGNEDGVINARDEDMLRFRRGRYYTIGFALRL